MLLRSFEYSKSGMRFATLSTPHVDPHDLDGLRVRRTSDCRLWVFRVLVQSKISHMYSKPPEVFSFSKGCKHLHPPSPGGGWSVP